MRARSTRWLGALTVLAGAALAASTFAAGCGGKTDEGGPTPEPEADTGVVIVDSAPDTSTTPDTSTPPPDTGSGGGSIFDAEMPDITFDGGTTAQGCYDCTITECRSEVEACDGDDKCRTLFVCAFGSCIEDFSDYGCLVSCALSAGVTSPSDPVINKALAIIQCNQAKCTSACPEIPDAGGLGDGSSEAAPPDSAGDAPADDASDAAGDAEGDAGDDAPETSAFMSWTPGSKAESVDPKLVEVLVRINTSISSPEARRGILDRLKH